MFDKLIYLASPYSHSDPKIQEQRFLAAAEATAKLQDRGHLIFSPIVHSHHCVPFTEKKGGAFGDWEALDKAFIDRCDEIWVLELDGWSTSTGVNAEVEYAILQGKRVRFLFDDLSVSEYPAHHLRSLGITETPKAKTQGDYNSEVEDVFGPGAFVDNGKVYRQIGEIRERPATFVEESPAALDLKDADCKYTPNCLTIADSLTSGDRQDDYGHPIHDFSRTALIWESILGYKVTPEQVALCMVGVKIARQVHKPKADNIIDGCGYFRTLEMINEYKND